MLRVASIGAGRRGRLCKLAHQPQNGVVLVGACDPRQEIQDEYRNEFGPDCFVTGDYRRLLDRNNIDAVFVTSPDYLHEEHVLASLQSGRGVYVEKPLAITIEGCDRILATAEKYCGKLYVGHNLRFAPVFVKMKELIDEGVIGEVQAIWCRHFVDYGGDAYFKDWHSEQQYTTGLLLQKGSHDIDVIHWLSGAYTQRTSAMGKLSVYNRVAHRRTGPRTGEVTFNEKNWPPLEQRDMSPNIDVEDHSMMLMQLSNGIQASYAQCHYTPDGHRCYTILGTHGRIENMGDHSTQEYEAKIRIWNKRAPAWREQGDIEISMPEVPGEHGGSDPLIVEDYLRYLRTGEYGGATPLDARMSVAAGYMATQSLRNGGELCEVPAFPSIEIAESVAR